jgi:adenosylcobinamide-phosphate synthase
MDESVILICSIVLAYVFDLVLGDPLWLPHPIVAFGKSISFFEKKLNKENYKYLKGGMLVFVLCTSTFFTFYFIINLALKINFWLFAIFNTIFLFYGIANKTLIKECRLVFKALNEKGLDAGRKQIARLVGRSTNNLSENKIKTATLETLSENLSDGVVAPLFYYLIGGIPAMMTYKMINTLDSMIAYKTEKYLKFGFFAAKVDDLANYLPARITAILMATIAFSPRSFYFIFKYRKAHSSPNAGYPEAALAGILNCRFGGSNVYHGQLVKKPFIGKKDREITKSDLTKAVIINHLVCFTVIVFTCLSMLL